MVTLRDIGVLARDTRWEGTALSNTVIESLWQGEIGHTGLDCPDVRREGLWGELVAPVGHFGRKDLDALCTRCRTSVTTRSGWARECLVRGLVWGTREDLVASPASKMDWWRLWCASGADEVRDDLGRLERLARETLEFVDWGDQGDGIVLLVRESWTDMNDVLSRFSGQFARKGPFTLAGIRLGAHKDSVTFWHRKGAHALWGVDEVEASALESFFSIWNGHTETVRAAWDAALLLERAACSESGS